MTHEVQICIPEECLTDPRFQSEAEYDQRIGRLTYAGCSTLVSIDGQTLNFPRAWVKHLPKGGQL